MTNARTTKKALLMSMLSLLLCFTMLLSTTFAWFTDTVTSANNIITAGNLDVELKYAKIKDGAITGWDTVQGKDNIFDKNALWEPGRVEVVYLEVSNLGSLALKYQLGVNVYKETPGTNMNDEEFKLSDYLVFKVVDLDAEPTTPYTREEAIAKAGAAMGLKSYNGETTALKVGGKDYVALIVYMPESVGNEANYRGIQVPQIMLGVNLYATQQNAETEKDSFDNNYDEGATHPDFKVTNAQDLKNALNEATPGSTIALENDVELDETLVIPAAATTFSMRSNPAPVVIDLNGKTITGNVGRDAEGNRVHVIVNNGNAVIKNGTVTAAGVNGGSAIYNAEGATMTIENITVNGAPLVNNGSWPSYGINNYGYMTINGADIKTYHGGVATNNGATTIINDANVNVGQGTATKITSYALYTSGTGNLTINGGTFANTASDANGTGGAIACAGDNAIVINGGSFSGGCGLYGSYVITGGTFDKDVSNHVASSFKVVKAENKYVVIHENVASENVIATSTQLQTALTNAADAGSGDNTIFLVNDIDLTGKVWTSISVDGYNGAGVITIEGNGATIKGLTAPLFAGGFAGKSGIVIKNLTIADSNIVSTSGLGGGAFIDSADSMHVITLENCNLINSTVSGERAGGLIGWCTGYAKLDDGPVKANVTISNCSVIDSTVHANGSAGAIAGHPGASDYTYTTIENCVVKNVEVISDEPVDSWRTGVIVGTANNGHVVINNVTVENVTLTQNGVTATETKLYGRFVPAGTGTLVIDGASVLPAATGENLNNAIASGNTNLYVPAGNYNMPATSGEVTISGTKDTVITINKPTANNVELNGVTVVGSGNYTGIQHSNKVVYENCVVKGVQFLYANEVKFINCTIDLTEVVDYIWTYGAKKVTFDGCTFNTNGKAILIYSEDANLETTVIVKNCTFNATASALAGGATAAAIEIDSSLATNGHYTLITENNTVDSDFSGEWRIKKSGTNNTTVNNVVYNAVTIDGVKQ